MKHTFFLTLSLLVAVSACNKIGGEGTKEEFKIMASPTKTANSGMKTVWTANDALTVFHTKAGASAFGVQDKFTASNPAAGEFTARIDALESSTAYDWYSIYPHSGAITSPANAAVAIAAATQTQTGNSSMSHICGSLCPLAGVAKGVKSYFTPSFQMVNLATVLKFELTNGTSAPITISNLRFTAPHPIAGSFSVDLTAQPLSVVPSVQTSNSITLTVTDPSPIASGAKATFYAAAAPFSVGASEKILLEIGKVSKEFTFDVSEDFASSEVKTILYKLDSDPGSQTPPVPPTPPTPTAKGTFLTLFEMPAVDAAALDQSTAVSYSGKLCHSTANEKHGSTKACTYNTTDPDRKVVVHTFETGGRVQRNYTILFDRTKRCALWAAWAANKGVWPDNYVSRNEGWDYDPGLPEDWQPNLSSSYGSYSRGHQVASEDRQSTVNQNRQTFYYSNMTPQTQALNGGTWNTLESAVQGLAYSTSGRDTLYVVTGPVFGSGYKTTTDKSGNACAVPTGYFKCLMLCSFDASGKATSAKGAGFYFDHSGSYARQNKTIDEIEKMVGLDLFANVPESIQNAAESQNGISL